EYFARAVKSIYSLVGDTTEHGFVVRVDLALRPNGNSGPSSVSLSALEEYLQVQGREWERFAWLKSRVVAPRDCIASPEVQALRGVVLPFVFRRYLDYSVFDALRVGSVTSNAKANYGEYARGLADEILALRAQGALRISHYLHLRAEVCSETLIEELAKFGPEDGIGIVSLMDHTPGQRQFRDISQLRAYVCGKHGLSEHEFEDHVAGQIALSQRLGPAHEAAAVAEARRFGAVLASHDDTTAEQVETSAKHGVQFAEFPTTLDAARACHAAGIKVMMGAPNLIRGGSHSGNVAASALAQADLLDIVSSDYVPSALLSSALMLGDIWGNMARGVACVTSAPAQAAGLADRGRLNIGLRADLVQVHRINAAATPRSTWVAGKRVA
ncbi:MAG: alpha-D-ribose 1-methylphosphonate 5-triphosphate diphosphatase, partial [Cypionkella sp.]